VAFGFAHDSIEKVGAKPAQSFGGYKIEPRGLEMAEAMRYRELSQLPDGGMSELTIATDTLVNDLVVLKTIKGKFLKTSSKDEVEKFCEMLLNELKVSDRLNHESILGVRDFIIHHGKPTIVMDFINGQSLRSIICQKGLAYNVGSKVNLLKQCCVGIDFAHSRGVIHYDLKPENVMITKDWDVKIIDFGLSRIMGLCFPAKVLSYWTPLYAAPEQCKRKKMKSVDIFAIGALSFELLTGFYPFRANNLEEVRVRVRNGAYQLPSNLGSLPIVYDKWCKVFDRVFQSNPEDRYQSADHFFTELLDCFNLKERDEWVENGRFRVTQSRFEVISELDEIRDLKWEKFRDGLLDD
jgi:serine/threonine-protein kinase